MAKVRGSCSRSVMIDFLLRGWMFRAGLRGDGRCCGEQLAQRPRRGGQGAAREPGASPHMRDVERMKMFGTREMRAIISMSVSAPSTSTVSCDRYRPPNRRADFGV